MTLAYLILSGKRGAARRLAELIKERAPGVTEEIDAGNIVLYGEQIEVTRDMIRRSYFPDGNPYERNVTRLFRWIMGRGHQLARITENSLFFADKKLPNRSLLVRLSPELKEKIKRHADGLGISQNQLVTMAVRDLIELLESEALDPL